SSAAPATSSTLSRVNTSAMRHLQVGRHLSARFLVAGQLAHQLQQRGDLVVGQRRPRLHGDAPALDLESLHELLATGGRRDADDPPVERVRPPLRETLDDQAVHQRGGRAESTVLQPRQLRHGRPGRAVRRRQLLEGLDLMPGHARQLRAELLGKARLQPPLDSGQQGEHGIGEARTGLIQRGILNSRVEWFDARTIRQSSQAEGGDSPGTRRRARPINEWGRRCLARSRSASAAARSCSALPASIGYTAMPQDTVTPVFQTTRSPAAALSRPSRMRPAMVVACSWSAPGSTHTNSSPPYLAAVSSRRRAERSTFAYIASTRLPVSWPNRSLISL